MRLGGLTLPHGRSAGCRGFCGTAPISRYSGRARGDVQAPEAQTGEGGWSRGSAAALRDDFLGLSGAEASVEWRAATGRPLETPRWRRHLRAVCRLLSERAPRPVRGCVAGYSMKVDRREKLVQLQERAASKHGRGAAAGPRNGPNAGPAYAATATAPFSIRSCTQRRAHCVARRDGRGRGEGERRLGQRSCKRSTHAHVTARHPLLFSSASYRCCSPVRPVPTLPYRPPAPTHLVKVHNLLQAGRLHQLLAVRGAALLHDGHNLRARAGCVRVHTFGSGHAESSRAGDLSSASTALQGTTALRAPPHSKPPNPPPGTESSRR